MMDNDEDCDRMDGTDDAYDAEMDADPQFGDATGAAGNSDMVSESETKQQEEKPKGRPRGQEKT
jgi:hypothetical protein